MASAWRTLNAMSASTSKPGRNDPCYCGSGKKYKHCHLAQDEAAAAAERAKAAAKAAEEAPAEAVEAAAAPSKTTRPPRHQTSQPWKATSGGSTHGFTPKARTPRKVGGS
jgi:hypothetical protein